MTDPRAFIASMAPLAQEIQRKYGVPASIVIAQAALESHWGTAAPGHNMFGIKAGKNWQGDHVKATTHEYVDGHAVKIDDRFCAYAGLTDSVAHYGQFLASNARYAQVLNAQNSDQAADALQEAGYATDPKYAQKLKEIIAANNLTKFDDAQYQGYVADEKKFATTQTKLQEERAKDGSLFDGLLEKFTQFFAMLAELVFGKKSDATTAVAANDAPAVTVPTVPNQKPSPALTHA